MAQKTLQNLSDRESVRHTPTVNNKNSKMSDMKNICIRGKGLKTTQKQWKSSKGENKGRQSLGQTLL